MNNVLTSVFRYSKIWSLSRYGAGLKYGELSFVTEIVEVNNNDKTKIKGSYGRIPYVVSRPSMTTCFTDGLIYIFVVEKLSTFVGFMY